MAERADDSGRSLRGAAEELFLAGVGVVALTKDRTEELVDEVVGRWRNEAVRASERAGSTFAGLFKELGLVTRRDYDELELRLAQLEHRLRLVEKER